MDKTEQNSRKTKWIFKPQERSFEEIVQDMTTDEKLDLLEQQIEIMNYVIRRIR